MGFIETLVRVAGDVLPFLVIGPLMLVPFIVAEQIWPVHRRPGWRDYGMNILISATTILFSLPLGILAGTASEALRDVLPWQSIAISYSSIGTIPVIGEALQVAAMILLPLIVHDLWFYWAHRIEHRVPFLWEFHKLHHSDELMNCSTWARDHFLQAFWVTVMPAFTLGLAFDISSVEAGDAAVLSMTFLSFLSMFYHSAICVRLPWLDGILVTPQVHRIHHSADQRHHDSNFADVFPLMDILFGTYCRPEPDEFPSTGLGVASPAPRSLWEAQAVPACAGISSLFGKRA